MSYILDALRKAERERRSGRIPTLDAHHSLRQATRRPVWRWLLGVALLVNVAVLGVYWRTGSRLVPSTDGHPEGHRAGPAVAAAPSRSTPAPSRPEPATAPPPAPAPPASGPDRTATAPGAGRSEPGDRGGGAAAVAPPATTDASARPAAGGSRSGGTPEEARPGAEAGVGAPRAARPVAVVPVAPLPAAPAPAALSPPAPPLVATSPAAPAPGAPAVAPISPGSRPAAPEAGESPAARESAAPGVPPSVARLSLDVLVYSAVPAERLVFINSRKYVEGQAIDGGFVIEAITADGAIVSGEGQRFLLRPRLNPYVRP